MTRRLSYSKLRKELMRDFREKMHKAESTEDVKKFYANTMSRFFDQISDDSNPVSVDDVTLRPSSPSGYLINTDFMNRPWFQSAWDESDLPEIVGDFTKVALNRHTRLEKNHDKTRSKIHHTDGKR